MSSMFSVRSFHILAMLFAGLSSVASPIIAAEIRVQLRETAIVNSNQVLLSSIATIDCSDLIQKAEVENVELKLLDLTQPSELISQRFVTIRLVVAGFSMDELKVSGASQTVVVFQPPSKLTDTQVEDQAILVLSQSLNAKPEDLNVLLQNGFVQSLPEGLQKADGLELKVLAPARRNLGPVTLPVQIWKNNQLVLTRMAVFEVRRRHRVAVARVSLSREVPVNESSVQFENRFLTTEVDELEPAQVLGRTVRGSLVAGSIVQMRDLQTETRSTADLLIKKGDAIQVLAHAGRLRTSIRNVESLQDGRLGERIRMKNRDSGMEIVGEVLGPGQAIVRVK